MTAACADSYFSSRPRDSHLGAWASDRSRPLDLRETFEARFDAMKARFEGQDVPRPPYWGGYRVMPFAYEFWQGRANRVHDRLRYDLQPDGRWVAQPLAP